MAETMNYKGIVTNFNLKLCCFTLDDIITVYCGYNFVKQQRNIPTLQEEVIVTYGQLYDSKYIFLTEKSEILCKNHCDDTRSNSETIITLIREFKLGAADLLTISHHVKALNEMNVFPSEYLRNVLGIKDASNEDIILKIIPHIAKKYETNQSIFNEIIPYCNFNTPSKYKICKNAKKLVSGTYWTFGVNCNEECEMLVGYLHLSEKLGFTVLADKTYFLVCLIVPEEMCHFSSQLQSVMNKIVIVKKYKIFSEMFTNADVIQYAYFSITDVKVIEINYPETINDITYNSEFYVSVLHRSSLIYQEPQFYCLIHCNIQAVNVNHEILLKIKGKNLKQYPFINKGDIYKLQFTEDKMHIENEIKKVEGNFLNKVIGMQSALNSFSLPVKAKMQLESTDNEKDELLSVEEAISLLKSGHNKVVSFQGIVVEKKFIHPLESRRKKPVQNMAFGTAGPRIHQIVLKNCRKESKVTCTNPEVNVFCENDEQEIMEQLYENNYVVKPKETLAYVYLYYWEKIHCPLGLLPAMRVAVKYFYPQNGSYFKPTILSAIEPLEYEPLFEFNTCYELQDNINWGPMFYLGDGDGVPTDCVCWGPTETIKIANLTITHTCKICDAKISLNQISCCEKTDYDMNIMLVMSIRDKGGNADVLTKNHDVLKLLMDYNQEEWDVFKEAMKKVALFFYSSTQNDIQNELNDQYIRFVRLLYLQINVWNLTEIHTLDLKCRKLDRSYRDIPFTPKWFCLEARRTEVR